MITAELVEAKIREDQNWLESSLRACCLCPEAAPLPGRGNACSRIMVVKDAPGEEERQAGQAFVGAVGQALKAAFEALGLDYEASYLTNAVKCCSAPEDLAVKNCGENLRRELDYADPLHILVLGEEAWAMTSTCLRMESEPLKGEAFRWREGGFLLRSLEPLEVLSSEREKQRLWRDLKTFAAALRR